MFCPDCNSLMDKSTETGEIVFKCTCSKTLTGTPVDSLMYEQVLVSANDIVKYGDMMKNALRDHARNIEFRQCPKCPLPFMTTIRVGLHEALYYLCECGYIGTREQYTADSAKK